MESHSRTTESADLFPRALSLLAAGLSIALVASAATLIVYMNRNFDRVHHQHFPILERASINVRLITAIQLQLRHAITTRDAHGLEELQLNLESIQDNLARFRESLAVNPGHARLLGAIGSDQVIKDHYALLTLMKQGYFAAAGTRAFSEVFVRRTDEFAGLLGDLTEALSQERDQEMARQLRFIRAVVFGFALIAIFLTLLFSKIYRAYQRNLERRLVAETRAAQLSLQRQQLIHVLCHDLGNPVASIAGFVPFAEREGDTRKKAIEMIRRSAAAAQSIIDQVRRMQALETGKLALDIGPHSVLELVRESLALVEDRAARKELTFVTEIDPALTAHVERTSFINSVLANILTNAIKFSARGACIELFASRERDRITLVVRDHGVGMPAAIREQVFNELATTSRRGTDGEEGTGFGMPLVRRFVLAYGGDVSVESSEAAADHGTAVKVELKTAA